MYIVCIYSIRKSLGFLLPLLPNEDLHSDASLHMDPTEMGTSLVGNAEEMNVNANMTSGIKRVH